MISAVTPGINYCSRVPGWPAVLAEGCFRSLSWLSYPVSSSTKPGVSHSSVLVPPESADKYLPMFAVPHRKPQLCHYRGMYWPLFLLTQQPHHVPISKEVFVVLFYLWQWSLPHWIRYYTNFSHIWGTKYTFLKMGTSSWNENAELLEELKNINL